MFPTGFTNSKMCVVPECVSRWRVDNKAPRTQSSGAVDHGVFAPADRDCHCVWPGAVPALPTCTLQTETH